MNDDGTLNLKGAQPGNAWDGLKWACDVSRFKRGGTVTVSAEGLPVNSEVVLRFDDKADAAHTFIYPARGENHSTGVVPTDAKTVFLAVRRQGKPSGLTSARVAIMVNEGDAALPFARPDVTDASGGGYELTNLWPTMPPSTQINGVTYTDMGNGRVHAAGTCTGWGGISAKVSLQPGVYTIDATESTNRHNLYAQIEIDGDTFNSISPKPITVTRADVYTSIVLTRNGSTVDDYITPRLYPNQ